MISHDRIVALQSAKLQWMCRLGPAVTHSMVAAELYYRQVIGRQIAGRSDTSNEAAATTGQLRHSRAVRAGWEDPLLAIKRHSYID